MSAQRRTIMCGFIYVPLRRAVVKALDLVVKASVRRTQVVTESRMAKANFIVVSKLEVRSVKTRGACSRIAHTTLTLVLKRRLRPRHLRCGEEGAASQPERNYLGQSRRDRESSSSFYWLSRSITLRPRLGGIPGKGSRCPGGGGLRRSRPRKWLGRGSGSTQQRDIS